MTNKPIRAGLNHSLLGMNRDIDRKELSQISDREPPQRKTGDKQTKPDDAKGARMRNRSGWHPARCLNTEHNANENHNPNDGERFSVARDGTFARTSRDRQPEFGQPVDCTKQERVRKSHTASIFTLRSQRNAQSGSFFR